MDIQKLALGSVQFGMEYGVGPNAFSIESEEVERILGKASSLGIDLVDTASLYGNAEDRLSHSSHSSQFRYITKTIKSNDAEISSEFVKNFKEKLTRSLELLGRVEGILFHRPEDVFKKGGEQLFRELSLLKEKGEISSLGFSIYDPNELIKLKEYYDFDLVQLPCNVFDQRLEHSEVVTDLYKKGVTFHARSAFLKGVIFLNESKLPEKLKKEADKIKRFKDKAVENDINVIDLAFSYLKKQKVISRVIIGAQNPKQLEESVEFYNNATKADIDYREFAFEDSELLNPGNW